MIPRMVIEMLAIFYI